MKKSILITGGNGYIAQSIFKALNHKYDITLLTKADCDLFNQEQVNYSRFFDKHYDVLIHTAVVGGSRLKPDSTEIMDQNLQMYYNLLNKSRFYSKFIHFGSGAEIIDTPHYYYGLSKKIIAESIKNKPNFYNLRIYGVFDENEADTRFIKSNILRYIKHEPMEVYFNKQMDFIYMPDLIKLVEYYIDNEDLEKEVDCVYGNTVSPYLNTITKTINNLDEYKVEINFGAEYSPSYGCNEGSVYATDILDFWIGLEEGIKQVYKKLKHA